MKFNTHIEKHTMHERPSYDKLLDEILNPKDKIDLPNRRATQLRKMQQLSMFDDSSFLDLHEQQDNIAKEQTQQLNLNRVINSTNTSAAAVKATQPTQPLPTAAASIPHVKQQSIKRTSLETPAGPPKVIKPLQSDSAAAASSSAAAASSSAAAASTPIFFDTSLDESMNDDKKEMETFLESLKKSESEKRESVAKHSAAGLESHASESVVSAFVKPSIQRSRSPPQRRTIRKSPPPKPDTDMEPLPQPPKASPKKPSQPKADVEMLDKIAKREGEKTASENKKAKLSSRFPPSLPAPPPPKSSAAPPPQPKHSSASSSAAPPQPKHSSASSSAAAAPVEPPKPKQNATHPKTRANSLPPPSRANLQIIRDTLLDAAHKNRLTREDAATVKLLVADLKPGKKNSKQANDELRAIYKKYHASLA